MPIPHQTQCPQGDESLGRLLPAVDGLRADGQLQRDLQLSRQIIAMAFTPDEMNLKQVRLVQRTGHKAQVVACLPWDGEGDYKDFAKRSGIAHNISDVVEPELNGENLARHLLPHFRQAAGFNGMSLEEYARFIGSSGNFQQEREWLRLPYTLNFLDTRHHLAGGFESGASCYYRHATLRESLKGLMAEKGAAGDLSLEIKSCGCGSGGEAYGLAVLARALADEVGGNWRIKVTGYSIHPSELESAEQGKVVLHLSEEELASETAANPFFRFARIESSRKSPLSGKNSYSCIIDPTVRDSVGFEWIDLLDTRQLERLHQNPSDLLSLFNTFYIYKHSNLAGVNTSWWTSPVHEALDSIIGSIRPGGIFMTDRDIDQTTHFNVTWRREKGLEPSPTLYFAWPGLTEVPEREPEKGAKVFPTSDAEAERKSGFTMAPELWWPVMDTYEEEIRAHDGRDPSGVYVKDKSR